MYKVVLIDDEDVIVKGLKKIVNWEGFGCEVAGTAGNARDGASMIAEIKPDILFTDIRMPGLDGLSMLAGLRSEYPDMQVIVLTGYRDFEYARKAINLGVIRFLLKPSKMNELEEAIGSAVEKLSKSKAAAGSGGSADIAEGGSDDLSENDAGSFVAKNAYEFIKANCAEKISLNDVAEHCFVSQWHLSKLLNNTLGKSFYDLLNDCRIDKAKELLKDPKLRIGEISEAVGYIDAGHFSRIFKKTTGLSPADYRNKL